MGLGLPESRNMVALSMGLFENTSLSFEYFRAEDYGTAVGGTGETDSQLMAQLAMEF